MTKQEFLDEHGDISVLNVTLSSLKRFIPEEIDIEGTEDAEELAETIKSRFKERMHRHFGNIMNNATVEALLERDEETIPTEQLKRKASNTGSASLRDKIKEELEGRSEQEVA